MRALAGLMLLAAGCGGTESPISHPGERVIRWEAVEPEALGHDLGDPLVVPWFFSSHAGDLYVLDGGDRGVKRYDTDGRLLNRITAGVGDGPGEVRQAIDYAFEADSVWVLDGNSRLIHHFKLDGTYLDRISLEQQMLGHRIRRTPDGFALVTMMSAELVTFVDRQGVQTGAVRIPLQDRLDPMALDGRLENSGEGIAYVPRFPGAYYLIRDGAVEEIASMDDPIEEPEAEAVNGVRRAPRYEILTGAVTADREGQYFSTVHREPQPDGFQTYVDHYDDQWRYQGTIGIRERAAYASIINDEVFARVDTAVVRFAIRLISEQ